MELKQLIKNTEERFISYKVLLEDISKVKLEPSELLTWYKSLLRDNKNNESSNLKKLVEEKTYENEGLNPPFLYNLKKILIMKIILSDEQKDKVLSILKSSILEYDKIEWSFTDPEFIMLQKSIGSSKFYKTIDEVKSNKQVIQKDIPFNVDITISEKIHWLELYVKVAKLEDFILHEIK